MRPTVSVIIPSYNRWPMLKDAVDSVLRQSYGSYELIIVDDGSTDETARRLNGFGDRLIVLSQSRRGVAAARNAGAAIAAGRYLAFLDSDDFWLPEKLAVQTAFMSRNPALRICQTEEIWIRRGRRVNGRARHEKPVGDIFQRSLELCLVSPSAVMMTRELFEDVGGFDESLPVCEDYDLWLRIAVDHDVSLIPERLVVKRGGHADQLSRSEWGMDRFRIRSLVKLLGAGLEGEKREWAAAALRRKVSIVAAGARKRGKEAEALEYEQLLSRCLEDKDVGRADSLLCGGEVISSVHRGAVARLERAG